MTTMRLNYTAKSTGTAGRRRVYGWRRLITGNYALKDFNGREIDALGFNPVFIKHLSRKPATDTWAMLIYADEGAEYRIGVVVTVGDLIELLEEIGLLKHLESMEEV